MKPLNDTIIIKDLTQEEIISPNGIVQPCEKFPKAHRPGEVIEVGKGYRNPDATFTSLTVEKGDKVLFHFATGREHEIDGKKFSVCKETDIVVITEYAPVKRDHKA